MTNPRFQVASDDPNVNVLFPKNLDESQEEKEFPPLLLKVGLTLSIIVLQQGLENMIHNTLLSVKPKFFEMVFVKLNAFLRVFKTSRHFIAHTVGDLVRNFFGRIIFKNIGKRKSSLYNLIQIKFAAKH